jgi:hypothetical protein
MYSFLESIWYRAGELPANTWQWFAGLSREEWLVTLAVVCACGFLSLRGFQAPRV